MQTTKLDSARGIAYIRDKLPPGLSNDRYSQLRILREVLRRFVADKVTPHIVRWEKEGSYDKDLVREMGNLGYLGMGFEEAYGGSSGDILDQIVMTEELTYAGACSLTDAVIAHAYMIAPYVAQYGTPAQKEHFLKPALQGRDLMAIAMTEADHGSDLRGIETRASRTQDGWVLQGQKMFITNALNAATFVVAAKTQSDAISLFLVRSTDEGVAPGEPLEKMGLHAVDTAPVAFDHVALDPDRLLGEEGAGMKMLKGLLGAERILASAMSIAGAMWCLDIATDYAHTRVQFGRPIIQFQIVRHRLADCVSMLDFLRQYMFHVALLVLSGREASIEIAILKRLAADYSFDVANQCLQLLGGYGYMAEYGVERMVRDLRLNSIGGGSSEIQREIIAQQMGWAPVGQDSWRRVSNNEQEGMRSS